MQRLKKILKWIAAILILMSIINITTWCVKVTNSLSNPDPQVPNNTQVVTPKPSSPQFDVRLNSGDRTTLKEYYTGDINGPKVILTIKGTVPGNGYVDSTYEWNKSTGQGTWKAEHHPVKGLGIRDDGPITVSLNSATGNYDLTTYFPDGQVKHTGSIIQVSNN